MIKNLAAMDLTRLIGELKLDKNPFDSNVNILCSNQDHLFLYIEQMGAFVAIHLATSKQPPQTVADSSVQYLNLNSPPVGHLKKCLMSPGGGHIMVICDKSATLVELPSKWGKLDRFEGGKKSIICKSVKLNVSKGLDIIDAMWHPSNRDSSVVICLTSDNYLRFYRIGGFSNAAGLTQFKEFHLERSYLQTNLTTRAFRILGIDAGARLRYCDKFAYPIFALKSNGQVECLIEYEESYKFEYLGPLDLAPYCMDVEEDNQVRTFVCLRGAPNCLSILLSSGIVYHCILMANLKDSMRFYESENNLKEFYGPEAVEANASGEAILFVYESVKLAEDQAAKDLNINFIRDPQNNWRYFICHANGAHSVSLPWFESLQEIYEKEESLSEFDESKLCEITQLISTRPFAEKPSGIRLIGSTLFFNFAAGEQALVCLTNEPKLIDLNTTTKANTDSENENDQFVNYIVSLMKRDASMPYVKCSAVASGGADEETQSRRLLNNAMNLIKAEYIEKQRLVIAEFKKKSKQLKQQESLQFDLIKEIEAKLEELKAKRAKLLSNVEKLYEDEQRLKKRMEDILSQLLIKSNVSKSDAENEIHADLKAIDHSLKESICKIVESQRILDQNRELIQPPNEMLRSNVDESDTKLIKSLLKNQSEKIKMLIQKVETISQSLKSSR